MTGFGSISATSPSFDLRIEIKSVNSKQFDCNLKLPHLLRPKENEIKSIIQNNLLRGKIDIFIHIELSENSNGSVINKTIFKSYYNELKTLCEEMKISNEKEMMECGGKFSMMSADAW